MKLKSITLFGFNKQELLVVTSILAVLIISIVLNLRVSYAKGRDLQRKNDISQLQTAITSFQASFGYYPPSDDEGRIYACLEDPENPAYDESGEIIFSVCEWGVDPLLSYLKTLPTDPDSEVGARYYYSSNGKLFQIFAHVERTSDPEYRSDIESRELQCGTRVCNFGRTVGDTPLDKSLEQLDNEIR